KRRMSREMAEHPDYAARLSRARAGAARINDAPQAITEVAYTDLGEAVAECDLFQRCAAEGKGFAEPFMTAASPGVIATIMLDAYYASPDPSLRPARGLRAGARRGDAQGVRADRHAGVRAPARLPGSGDGARPLLPGRAARSLPGRRRPSRRRHQRRGEEYPARSRALAPVLGE